jgi:hypothetical protein
MKSPALAKLRWKLLGIPAAAEVSATIAAIAAIAAIAVTALTAVAQAGVLYDVEVRPLDQTNLAPSSPGAAAPAVVTQYFAEGGKVRIGGPNAKMVYLFMDGLMLAIDHTARAVHVLKHATLTQVAQHYADAVKQLETAAATAPADQRADAQSKAESMKAVSDRLLQPVTRDYRVTARFESADGRACRIWEEREGGAKRLELCIAPTASVPGGADILGGMKTLSQFRQGASFAFAVDFGLSAWWPDIDRLGGVPLLIREYKYDSVVSEVLLTAIRPGVPRAALLDVPESYAEQEGPDYTQWYLR